MPQMTPFKYGGFWDVPRYIALEYRGRFLLLESEFDDELDDYPADYTVYALPNSVADALREGSWDFYKTTPKVEIGKIPVQSVFFDESKRKELDASCLDDLIEKHKTAQ